MKDALPLQAPVDDNDDTQQPQKSEPMKGGLSATATGGSPEAPVRPGAEEPMI
jgi:hypothetical protein